MTVTTWQERPRAFYPQGLDARPARAETPGWDLGPERRLDDGRTTARALGWLSLGLGVLQVTAPDRVAEFLGLDEDDEPAIRIFGVRELAHGVAILSRRAPATAVMSRVAGDVLDLAALGLVFGRRGARRNHVLLAAGVVLGITLLDGLTARRLRTRSRTRSRASLRNGAG